MILRATADTVRLDCDEHGWQLVVDTEEGDSLIVNIQGAAYKFAGSKGLAELMAWWAEAQQARAYVCVVDESAGLADGD